MFASFGNRSPTAGVTLMWKAQNKLQLLAATVNML